MERIFDSIERWRYGRPVRLLVLPLLIARKHLVKFLRSLERF